MPLLRRETDKTSLEYGSTPAGNEPTANRPDIDAPSAPQLAPQLSIQRLLFVADTAVADVHASCPLEDAPSSIPRLRSMW